MDEPAARERIHTHLRHGCTRCRRTRPSSVLAVNNKCGAPGNVRTQSIVECGACSVCSRLDKLPHCKYSNTSTVLSPLPQYVRPVAASHATDNSSLCIVCVRSILMARAHAPPIASSLCACARQSPSMCRRRMRRANEQHCRHGMQTCQSLHRWPCRRSHPHHRASVNTRRPSVLVRACPMCVRTRVHRRLPPVCTRV